MPYVHRYTLRVRHYECDAYGHVSHANYLRYMQEAAFSASAAVGYSARRYAEIGLHWLAYETEIAFAGPLYYDDLVEIKTWVADFRKVRSLRQYEFYRSGEQVARASTDWALIDTARNFPAAIPPEIIAAYAQGENVTPAAARPPFPPSPPPPPDVFGLRRRVEWHEIDPAGHVNNAVYLAYALDCGLQAAREYGWPVTRWQAENAALSARQHWIEYKAAALLDDTLEISTWVSDAGGDGFMRHYAISRPADGKLLARLRSWMIWLDLNTQQPAPIPAAFLDALAPNMAAPQS